MRAHPSASPGGREVKKPTDRDWGANPIAVERASPRRGRGGSPVLEPETVDSGFHPHSSRRRLGRMSWRGAWIDPVFP